MALTLKELREWFDYHKMADETELWVDEDGLYLCADIPGDRYIHALEIGDEPDLEWEEE